MKMKNIVHLLLLLFTLTLMSVKTSHAVQQIILTDSVQRVIDSLQAKRTQDSIALLFETTYQAPIFLNPYRTSWIEGKLTTAMQHPASPYLIALEPASSHIAPLQPLDGAIRTTRPAWVVVSALFLIFVVAAIRLIFPTEFRRILEAYYRERLLQQVSKEDSIATSWPYVFLYVVYCFSVGLLIVVTMSEFSDKNYLTVLNFLRISGVVAAVFVVKILLIRFISHVFQIEKIVREYVAVIYLIYFNSMFLMLPFLLCFLFIPVGYFNILLILLTVLVCLMFIYRFLRTAMYVFSSTKFSISYLILYLCALEIAPVLVLIRALNG